MCKILRLFANTFTVDGKYSLLNRDNLMQPIQMQLSQKHKTFSELFSKVLKSTLNFEHFQTKLTPIAIVFPKLRSPKNVVRKMSKKRRWRVPFNKQHLKRTQTRFISERRHLYHIYWSLRRQLSMKKSLLVICKILRLFTNRFTADGKYSLLDRDNLWQPIQMRLSQKQKNFSRHFSEFLKSR